MKRKVRVAERRGDRERAELPPVGLEAVSMSSIRVPPRSSSRRKVRVDVLDREDDGADAVGVLAQPPRHAAAVVRQRRAHDQADVAGRENGDVLAAAGVELGRGAPISAKSSSAVRSGGCGRGRGRSSAGSRGRAGREARQWAWVLLGRASRCSSAAAPWAPTRRRAAGRGAPPRRRAPRLPRRRHAPGSGQATDRARTTGRCRAAAPSRPRRG